MIKFLHSFNPNPVFFSAGTIHIYWYGLIVVLSILAGLAVTVFLGKKYNIQQDTILDLAFWLIIGGIIGARLYDVLLELPYYIANPLNVVKIWRGGLAIHGAIFVGLIILWQYAKKLKINLWLLGSIIVPGLALGQAFGRWGNYFNQELFGQPTTLPWGIPINFINRPAGYLSSSFFQPTFLYESLGSLLIFILLFSLQLYFLKQPTPTHPSYRREKNIVLLYLALYSLLRFSLEFIRIDYAPTFYGLRTPQIVSLLIVLAVLGILLASKQQVNRSLEK